MAAKVGGLFIDLEAASAGFSRDMGKASKSLASNSAKMNRSMGKIQRGFGRIKTSMGGMGKLFGALSVVALGGMAKKALDAADAIGKAARASGLSTDAMQKYAFAAKLAGGSTQGFQDASIKFAKTLGELRSGTGGLFEALKKNLRDDIPVVEMDCNVNDPEFAQRCAETLLASMGAQKSG